MGYHLLRRRRTQGFQAAIPTSLALALAFVIPGCLRHHSARSSHRPRSIPPSPPLVHGEEGLASWYGHPYHGRQAASGEIYNMYQMTAAHRTLPFGTQVRVRNLENGAEAIVRINDRGPFVEGRILDLSYAAAKALGFVGRGVARVRLEVPKPELIHGPSPQPGVYAVQVGAFRERARAERLQQDIGAQFQPVAIQSFDRGDGLFHRVRVGQASTEQAARALAQELIRANLATETFVIRVK